MKTFTELTLKEILAHDYHVSVNTDCTSCDVVDNETGEVVAIMNIEAIKKAYGTDYKVTKVTYDTAVKLVTYKLAKRRNSYDEYVIRSYTNGKYREACSYYTEDFDDALATLNAIAQRENKSVTHKEGSNVWEIL